jgi:hypothetical protein
MKTRIALATIALALGAFLYQRYQDQVHALYSVLRARFLNANSKASSGDAYPVDLTPQQERLLRSLGIQPEDVDAMQTLLGMGKMFAGPLLSTPLQHVQSVLDHALSADSAQDSDDFVDLAFKAKDTEEGKDSKNNEEVDDNKDKEKMGGAIARFYRCHRDGIDLSFKLLGSSFSTELHAIHAALGSLVRQYPAASNSSKTMKEECSIGSFAWMASEPVVQKLVAYAKDNAGHVDLVRPFLPTNVQRLLDLYDRKASQ